MPRDAVLMGSVACTVNTNLRKGHTFPIIRIKFLFWRGLEKQFTAPSVHYVGIKTLSTQSVFRTIGAICW